MDHGSEQDSSQELLGLAQAVREAEHKLSYQQLWRAVRAGRIEAYQPAGPRGRYAITRAELERLIQPVKDRQ